jgi:hypothetical protein
MRLSALVRELVVLRLEPAAGSSRDLDLPVDDDEELVPDLAVLTARLAGSTSRSSNTCASWVSSLRERPSKSGARLSACTLVS